jgi:hypothetical protein
MVKSNTAPRAIGRTPVEEILNNKADYQKPIAKVKSVYETLELGVFNDDILTEVISEGTERILTDYKANVEKEIEGSGIKSARMKDILMQAHDDAVAEMNLASHGLLNAVNEKKKEINDLRILSKSLEMIACGFEKQFVFSNDPKNTFKRLTLGKNSWIAVKEKSWSFKYCDAMMHPDLGPVYLYAECPADMSLAKLVVSYEPLPNTPTHYLVLIQKADFEDIDYTK